MKIKNILLTGVAALSLASCNDFLDVEAPSAYTDEFVFSMKSETERALNGVYAQAIVNNLYGNQYQRTFILNSDVDMQISSSTSHAHNSYARFDCDDQGSELYSFWTAAYNLIEYANKFIKSAENSDIYYVKDVNGNFVTDDNGNQQKDTEVQQWIGEAKCLRAMAYHDLVVMFGDIPFTFEPAAEKGNNFVIPVADREEIQKALIDDLKEASLTMSSTSSTTVERCSKEFAQAMIARIALTAGGYSLRPNKSDTRSYGIMQQPADSLEYFKTAMAYADSVISAGTHRLRNTYQEVFVKESDYQVVNDDDPIFEIPFTKESTGNTGYIQGPTYSSYEGETVGVWGATSGNGRLNAFYRFLFRDNDKRREFVNGMWYYTYNPQQDGTLKDSVVIRRDYTVHNNKWSKLWTSESNALGSKTTGATGINYPYMRYADVLLMYAEAANKVNNGPTDEAIAALTEVHSRAFTNGDADFITEAKASRDAFQKAVLNERKWEFAGENMRWRDLVRTNTLAEEIVYSFLRYYAVGMQGNSSYEDAIDEHDGYASTGGYISTLPGMRIYYHPYQISQASTQAKNAYAKQLYGYVIENREVIEAYPNQSLPSVRIYNAYKPAATPPTKALITRGGFSAEAWLTADFYAWYNDNNGTPVDQCKYSFYGYIRSDAGGNIWLIRDGVQTQFSNIPAASELPVVRYILPYPNLAIQRSNGAYKNYYGY